MKSGRLLSPAGLVLALLTGVTLESCGGDGGATHATSSGGGRSGGNAGAGNAGEGAEGARDSSAGEGGEGGDAGSTGATAGSAGATAGSTGEAGQGGHGGAPPGAAGSAGLAGHAGAAEAGMPGQGGTAGEAGGPGEAAGGADAGSPGDGGTGPGSGDCPRLQDPDNGSVDDGGAIVDAIAKYACEHGYRLELSGLRVCRPNGTWSGTEPICDRLTCNPISFQGGTVSYDPPDRGCDAEATFRCNAGNLSDKEPRVCTCETGVWMPPQAPTCQ